MGCCLLSACQEFEKPLDSQQISPYAVVSASITHNGIFLGTLENGAVAYLSSATEPNYYWRNNTPNQQPIVAIAYAAKKHKALTASANTLTIWDTQSGKNLHYLSSPAAINALAINQAGTVALLGLANKTALAIDLEHGGIIQTLVHSSQVVSVSLLDNGLMLTGEKNNKAHLWMAGKDQPLFTQEHGDSVTLVRFSADGSLAVSASRYDIIKIWQTTGDFAMTDQISSKARALKAGRRALDVAFIDSQTLLILYSDRVVEKRNINEKSMLKAWDLSTNRFLAKDSSAVIAIGQFDDLWQVATSKGVLFTLGN
jgi:DNA polymerase III psi subunit